MTSRDFKLEVYVPSSESIIKKRNYVEHPLWYSSHSTYSTRCFGCYKRGIETLSFFGMLKIT